MAKLEGWRRVANALWRAPNDPQIYGVIDLDATAMIAFIDKARAAGHRVTPTHVVGRAMAKALGAVPELNVRLRGMRAIPRESIDIFFITAVHEGHDLSGVKVRHVDRLSVYEVASEIGAGAPRLKSGHDPEFQRTKKLTDTLPRPLLKAALRTTTYLAENLSLDIKPLGLHANPFGSAMITSVGSLGLPQGFAPLAWMYGVPLLILVGELTEKALVIDHEVRARPVLPMSATIDHRYVDGWHVKNALAAFQEYLEGPEQFEPAPPELRATAA